MCLVDYIEHRETEMSQPATYHVPREMMNRIYNVLRAYANTYTYLPQRTGGVLAGCPRSPTPTPDQLAIHAKWMLRDIDANLLHREPEKWLTDPNECVCTACGVVHQSPLPHASGG